MESQPAVATGWEAGKRCCKGLRIYFSSRSYMSRRTRNVYLALPAQLHLEVRSFGLRSRRTVDDLYSEAALLLLRKYGVEVEEPTRMDLTTEVDGATIR